VPSFEALDCRVYARAAAWIAGADRSSEEGCAELERGVNDHQKATTEGGSGSSRETALGWQGRGCPLDVRLRECIRLSCPNDCGDRLGGAFATTLLQEGATVDRERTRAARAERRKDGVRLGNLVNATEAAALGRQIQVAEADRFAANMLPVIAALQAAGITDLRGLPAALNARGIPTARGGKWHVSNVRNIIARAPSPEARPINGQTAVPLIGGDC
jgi:hypothetical protein